jgi:hypothetical protein
MLHELWREDDPDVVGHTLCLAGPRGDQARAMLGENAKLIWTLEAPSHFEAMTIYYAHMGWGEYTPMDAELDGRSYAELGLE